MFGKKYERDGFVYQSERAIWKTEMPDYTILSDSDFSSYSKYAPKSLKEKIKSRWLYNLHIGQSDSSTVTSQHLHQRIKGGELLAYKFADCIIEGNTAFYCGYIPTIKPENTLGTHQTCRFSLQEIYPRKLYVYLTRRPGRCVCSFDDNDVQQNTNYECAQWQVHMYDGSYRVFCSKTINWSDIYIFMGESDTECREVTKILRDCPVCAQCYKCSIGAFYCRTHVVCRHKKAQEFVGENSSLAALINKPKPTIKRCKKNKL